MAETNRVEITGLNEVLRDLRRFGDKDTPKAIRVANKKAAEVVVPTARAEAPKRSGRLAASVAAKATQKYGAIKAGTAARVPYAGPIHFGWWRHHIRANPFLYRALDKRIGEVYAAYERQMNKVIERFNR